MRDSRYFALWERRGFHVLRSHFYSPVPDTRELPEGLFEQRSASVGIDWNETAQLELIETFQSRYKDEYDRLSSRPADDSHSFTSANSSFGSPDAEVLYSMIRHYKPRRLVEIGSGHSTRLAAHAIGVNHDSDGHECELIAIEPFPDATLQEGFPGLRLIPEPVQSVPLAEFAELRDGDILFIDSSHVLKIGSDVKYEYLEILPRLSPGVFVHIHDVFLPAEYPRTWIRNQRLFFTEQYLLQAFLAFNRTFEVVWAGHYMHLRHPEKLRAAFRSCELHLAHGGGGSFWIRRVA